MCTFGDILKNIIIFIPFLKLLSNVYKYESFRKVECIDIIISIIIIVIVISLSLSFFFLHHTTLAKKGPGQNNKRYNYK